MVLDVYEHGHLCRPRRTFGRTLPPENPSPKVPSRVETVHPFENARAALGFDMRQTWAELVEIPPSGGLDEFARKVVRNDYPLLALWEMGVRRLRVPLQDLADDRVRDRMRELHEMGHAFTVFSFEVPEGKHRDALCRYADLVEAWEIGFA